LHTLREISPVNTMRAVNLDADRQTFEGQTYGNCDAR
jgi:hypothetical protein